MKEEGPPGMLQAARDPGGLLYFTTWDREGSRTRRVGPHRDIDGTTSGGVVPGQQYRDGVPPDSGAGTAFLVTHGKPSARAAQRRPGAEAPELDLDPQVASPFRVRRSCCRAGARGGQGRGTASLSPGRVRAMP